jgi:hypothetical protein
VGGDVMRRWVIAVVVVFVLAVAASIADWSAS